MVETAECCVRVEGIELTERLTTELDFSFSEGEEREELGKLVFSRDTEHY
jgi:hypothetical protein